MNRMTRLWAVLVFLLGAFLRFYKLSALSLWTDEGISWQVARSGVPDILRTAALDVHPPLYYLSLHFWTRLFGTSEAALRSLSAVAGILALPLIYLIAKRLFDDRVAIVAMLAAALSPFLVWYSQEARSYSLLLLLSLGSVILYLRFLDGRRWALPVYVPVTAAMIYTHYYGFWVIAAELLHFVFRARRQAEARSSAFFGLAIGLVGLAFLPWVPVVLGSQGGELWRFPVSLMSLPKIYALLNLGRSLDLFRVGKVIHTERAVPVLDWVMVGIGLVALSYLVLMGLLARGGRDRRDGPRAGFATWYLIVPLALVFVVSLAKPVLDSKSMIVIYPALVMLQARGLALSGRRLAAVSGALVLVVFGYVLGNYYFNTLPWKEDFRGAAAYVAEHDNPGDVVAIYPDYLDDAFEYYYRSGPATIVRLSTFGSEAGAQKALGEARPAQPRGKLWLIESAYPEANPAGYGRSFLAARFDSLAAAEFSGLSVRELQTRGTRDLPAVAMNPVMNLRAMTAPTRSVK